MSALRPSIARLRAVVGHLPALGALVVGMVFSTFGMTRALRNRLPLELLWGGFTWAWLAALALSVLLGVLALILRLRSLARSRPARSMADLRALICVLAAAAAGFLIALQPFQRLYWDMSAGLAWGGFAAWIAVDDLVPARLPTRLSRTIGMVLVQICLALAVSEISLRLVARFDPSPLFTQLDALPEQFQHLYRAEPGSLRFGFPCNSTGHYDEEFTLDRRTTRRVITIGDSFSMGVVPHHYHFTTVCERRLGDTEVLNMGFEALGPVDYMHLLRAEALPLRPDLVVIDLFVGNDIGGGVLRVEQPDRRLRRWFDRRNLLLWLVPSRLKRVADLRPGEAGDERDSQAIQSAAEGRAGRIAPQELEDVYPWLADPLLESPTSSESIFLPLELQRARHACGPGAHDYRELERVLADMQKAAGSKPLAVLLIPDEFQVEDELWAQIEHEGGEPLERDRPQRMLANICARLQIPLLDLLPMLRALAPLKDGRRHLYHLRDTHFNARGNAIAGEELALFVRRLLDS